MKSFEKLTEREVLALAISLEEEDERVYADFAEGLRENFPASAAVCEGMRKEESEHRRRLIELYQEKFGDRIPLIRRQDVRGFVQRTALWLVRPLRLDTVRKQASAIEYETRGFYEKAAVRSQDASIRQLFDDLANEAFSRGTSRRARKGKVNCRREGRGRGGQSPVIRAADRTAGTGRLDGWIGFDAGAGICRSAGHAQQLGGVPGRTGRVGGRRHQHGIRGGALRRWKPDGSRTSVGKGARVRRDDGAGRDRAHAAIPDS